MKRFFRTGALSIVLLLFISALQATAEDHTCSNISLKGSYGFVLNGTIVGFGPLAIVGLASFDGAGNWSRNETAVINGNVLPPETVCGHLHSECGLYRFNCRRPGAPFPICDGSAWQGAVIHGNRPGGGKYSVSYTHLTLPTICSV